MKILIYGINFSPELTGIGKYTGEMAAWLAARGHAVRVVTAPPYYPDWKIGAGFRNGWSTEVMYVSGAAVSASGGDGRLKSTLQNTVYRCPLWVPTQPGGIKRLVHLASFALTSLPVLLRQAFWRPDVVWVVEPALFCAPGAVALAKICGAKAWLHVQDFEVDAAFDMGLLRGKRLRSLVAGAERWLMRRFDVVSTISQRMHQRLLDKGVAPAKALLAVNWVDMAAFALPSPDGVAAYRRELDVPEDAVVALYSGNMGGKQGLEVLAEVARMCQDSIRGGGAAPTNTDDAVGAAPSPRMNPELVFVFCGNGAGRADLVARCQGLSNVRFLDLQPAERLADLLATADIHLLPQRADAADLVMPSKLTGMLASARPVVATAHVGTELAMVVGGVGHAACGVVVPPGDAPAFATAVQALAANLTWRQSLGAAGHLYAQTHLDRDAVLGRFEADLLQLVAKAPPVAGV